MISFNGGNMTYRIMLGLLCALLSLGCNLKGVDYFTLEYQKYNVLKDAVSNQSRTIGPYCCTGKTLTIKSKNTDPIGYIHTFSWQGKSYKTQNGKAYSKLEILVSGIERADNPQPEIVQSSLLISADQVSSKQLYKVTVGCVSYHFYDLKVKVISDKNGKNSYFNGFPSDLKVDVSIASCKK